MICKLALVGLFLQEKYNDMEIWLQNNNPVVWLVAILVAVVVVVLAMYVLYRWIFEIPRIILLLEGIYQQQGGKLEELYKQEPEAETAPGSGS